MSASTRGRVRVALAAAAAAAVGLLVAPSTSASPHPPRSRTISVPDDAPTIQAAVDSAAPGDTVRIAPGVYREEVMIDEDVDLVGAGVDRTVIAAPGTLTNYGVHLPDGRALTAIVRVGHGAHVRVSRLTVSGPIPCGVEVTGMHALQSATLELTDARVTAIQADPATCAPEDAAGRAVVYGTPAHIDVDGQRGTTAYGRVAHVLIDHYQHAGLSVTGPDDGTPSNVTVVDNIVRGGWDIPTFQVGMWIAGGAVVHVSGNTIDGNRCGGEGCGNDPINQGQGIGVFLFGVPMGSHVEHNRLEGNDVGLNLLLSPNCCRVRHNTLVDNRWFGIVVQDGNGSTNANRITGGETGIAVVADAVDTTATSWRDHITDTTSVPVREIDCCGFTATAVVRPR